MTYLSAAEYESYGLESITPPNWITAASTIMEAYCRRDTLGVAQYTERIRLDSDRNTVRLSYLPLAVVAPATSPVCSARGRLALPRRGEWLRDDLAADIALMFGVPGTWSDIDSSLIDFYEGTGELTLPTSAMGLGYSELEVTYTAGVEPIPDAVKVACAQIVRNAQATPALNVRAGMVDRMHLQYFSDNLIDSTVKSILAPFVAQKAG